MDGSVTDRARVLPDPRRDRVEDRAGPFQPAGLRVPDPPSQVVLGSDRVRRASGTSGRFLVNSASFPAFNIAAQEADPAPYEGYAGRVPSGPKVYIDANVPVTDGSGTPGGGTADIAIGAIWDDIWLFEGEPRTDVFDQTLSGTLEIRYRLYNYIALLQRYGASVAIGTGSGFAAPTTVDGTAYRVEWMAPAALVTPRGLAATNGSDDVKEGSRCSLDGCERPEYARSLCKLHYERQRKHGALQVSHRKCLWCGNSFTYLLKRGYPPATCSDDAVGPTFPSNAKTDMRRSVAAA